jgi:aldose 1-epimerase
MRNSLQDYSFIERLYFVIIFSLLSLMKQTIGLLIICLAITGCSTSKKQEMTQQKNEADRSLGVDTLINKNGMVAVITTFGGKLVSLWVPDKLGKLADVVLGYETVDQYPGGNPYFGAMIGRYGNRIAQGRFVLDGTEYQLTKNNGPNALHGGPGGFHNVNWNMLNDPSVIHDKVQLAYLSKDGEEGYPGNLQVKVTYTLTDNNELVIDYEATTDKTTIVNLTHHSFFNLAGAGAGDILSHQLYINADRFTPVDETLIPTGELRSVKGTPFDFNVLTKIGERIEAPDEQLKNGKGYDHNWVLNKNRENELSLAAKVVEPVSGRVMEVLTTEPGLQFYSGNFLNGYDVGKGGKRYEYRSAFCLEAQHFPDSPNKPHFPPVVLRPGDVYTQKTIYRFSTL